MHTEHSSAEIFATINAFALTAEVKLQDKSDLVRYGEPYDLQNYQNRHRVLCVLCMIGNSREISVLADQSDI